MAFRKEVHAYGVACEQLFAVTKKQPLTAEEAHMVEYYCVKLLADIAPYLAKDDQQNH
jgi:hypothetical protein